MKKMIQSLGILLMLCVMIYPMSKIDRKGLTQKANSVYILTSNQNHLHDQTMIKLNEDSYVSPSVLFDNYSLPFNNQEAIRSLKEKNDVIESIYPLYPLRTRHLTFGKTVPVTVHKDNKNKEISIPYYKLGLDNQKINYVSGFDYRPYLNEDTFLKTHNVFKTYECDTGIYLSEDVYRHLNLWTVNDHLSFTCPVSIPIACQIIDESFYGMGGDLYEVTQYAFVEYTFEIEGIFFAEGMDNCIYIPQQLSWQIYNSVKQEDYQLNEGEVYFEPNTWIIECQDYIEMDDLGIKLDDDLENFLLAFYDNESNRKLYE